MSLITATRPGLRCSILISLLMIDGTAESFGSHGETCEDFLDERVQFGRGDGLVREYASHNLGIGGHLCLSKRFAVCR